MYCYTVASGLGCVLRELLFWSNTSKEHQTFILAVADLTNKNLSTEIEDQLMELHDKFEEIEDHTKKYNKEVEKYWPCPYLIYYKIGKIISKFLHYNCEFLNTLQTLKTYGAEDQVWQTLLEHIDDEQKYMGRLLNNLLHQL